MIKIFINGFGRIGNCIFELAKDDDQIKVVGINDIYQIKNINGVKIYTQKDPKKLDLQDVDVLIQSSGVFLTKEQNEIYLKNGAKKVLITAPSPVPTFIYGINHDDYKGEKIISSSSCSITAIAPIIKTFFPYQIKAVFASMIHSYTSDQPLLDENRAFLDLRRNRSATLNILPLLSSASKEIKKFFPSLHMEAKSIRVPLKSCTYYDISLYLQNEVEDFFNLIKQNFVFTAQKLVSSDFIGNKEALVVDINQSFYQNKMAKICAWQDNEVGYSNQVIKLIKAICDKN